MERIGQDVNSHLQSLINMIVDLPIDFTVYAGTKLLSVTVSNEPVQQVSKERGKPEAINTLRTDLYTTTYSAELELFSIDQLKEVQRDRLHLTEDEAANGLTSPDALRASQMHRDKLARDLSWLNNL